MYEFRQIIMQMRLGESDRSIASRKLAGRNKCKVIRAIAEAKRWLNHETPLPDDKTLVSALKDPKRKQQSISSVEPYKDEIIAWYQQGISSTVIHQTLTKKYGFSGCYNAVQRFTKKLSERNIKATMPLDFAPGEAAQVDFGKGPDIIDRKTGEMVSTWFFVMTLCYSRHMYVEVVRHQTIETWLCCHRRAFEWFGGVPAKIIIDNPKCAITRACYYDPEVQRAYREYAEGYQFIISPCPPREPQMKGRVESGVKYVKRNFLPLRTFNDLADANFQAQEWVLFEAGNRKHGSTYQKPLTLFENIEKVLLKPLPIVPPQAVCWERVKVHGDCHVQHRKARYSVPYRYIHQTVWLRAAGETVQIYVDHEMVACHVRLGYPGERSTHKDHLPPNAQAYLMRDPTWCRKEAYAIGPGCLKLIEILFADKVLDNLRAAQGIIALHKKYGKARLELACQRALNYDAPRYKTVKGILINGLEREHNAVQKAFELSNTAYTKGRFCRQFNNTH